MRIRIIQIGKNKDKYIEEGTAEFLKRLRGFADVEILTLKEILASKTFTKEHAMEEEGIEILAKIGENPDDFIIVLDEHGKEFSSVDFSKMIGENKNRGGSLTFVIGGPYGLSAEVKKRASLLFSLSKLTFTHQMIRLFLLEQIYRGFCILSGKEYHNV